MTDTPPPASGQPWRASSSSSTGAGGNSGWVTGLVLFAGVLMLIGGIMDVFRGIMAIAKDDIFVTTPNYVFHWSLNGWGWIHVIIGALVALVGVCVILGMAWARYVGIFVVALSGLGNFLALPYYPFWSLIVIAIDIFVIWALCAYRPDDSL
ncbi:hypothetical protein [Kitasatospora sp. NPDC050543]|uniref:DUF7144 family membrane protein n=1 Tax=Kitasatospora sp. NPDC050543 TaxID=3364054 RepID=UPI0037BB7901